MKERGRAVSRLNRAVKVTASLAAAAALVFISSIHSARAQGIFQHRAEQKAAADRQQRYASCNQLVRLVEGPFPWPPGVNPNGQITADQLNVALVALTADERFVPVFGKPFDQLGDDERKSLHELEMTCRSSDQIIALEGQKKAAIMRITHFPADRALLTKRNNSSIFGQLVAQLDSLPSTTDGYAQLQNIETANRNAVVAAPVMAQAYSESLNRNRTRILLVVDLQRAETVVASASGFSGLMAASQLLHEFRSQAPDATIAKARAEYVPRLDHKIVELLPGVEKQAEADYVSALGKYVGLDAVAAAKKSESEVQSQWSSFNSLEAKPNFPGFRSRYRNDLLQRNSPQLIAKITAAEGGPELDEIYDRYVCDCDRDAPAIKPVLEAIKARRKVITPFDGLLAGDYLDAVYSGRKFELDRAHAKYFAGLAQALDSNQAMVKRMGGGQTLGRESATFDLIPRVLKMYVYDYQDVFAKCLRPDSVTIPIEHTLTRSARDGFGNESHSSSSTTHNFRMNTEFAPAFRELGELIPDDLAEYDIPLNGGRIVRMLYGLSDAMAHFDCADPRIKQLEKNMLKFYNDGKSS